jgi:hypothetical protein
MGVSAYSRTGRQEIVLLDEQPSVTYVGYASPSADQSSAVWKIKRLLTTGTVLAVEFADGNPAYDNIWNDRASLTYS